MITKTFLNIPVIIQGPIHIRQYDCKDISRLLIHYKIFTWGHTNIPHCITGYQVNSPSTDGLHALLLTSKLKFKTISSDWTIRDELHNNVSAVEDTVDSLSTTVCANRVRCYPGRGTRIYLKVIWSLQEMVSLSASQAFCVVSSE